jgi:hypothetical protein
MCFRIVTAAQFHWPQPFCKQHIVASHADQQILTLNISDGTFMRLRSVSRLFIRVLQSSFLLLQTVRGYHWQYVYAFEFEYMLRCTGSAQDSEFSTRTKFWCILCLNTSFCLCTLIINILIKLIIPNGQTSHMDIQEVHHQTFILLHARPNKSTYIGIQWRTKN